MEHKGNHRDKKGWSVPGPHVKFLELCAISTSGNLTEAEQKDLQAHLAGCPDCRQASKEFEAAADFGMPLLHSHLAGREPLGHRSIPAQAAKAVPSTAVEHAQTALGPRDTNEQSSAIEFSERNGHRQRSVNWNYVWMPFAAAVVLTAALGIYSYQMGKQNGQESDRVQSGIPASKSDSKPGTKDDVKPATNRVGNLDALEQEISDAGHDREVLKTQLADRDRVIADLRHQIAGQSAALGEMKSAQIAYERSLESDKAAAKQQAALEQSNLSQRLAVAQSSLQKTQVELESLRQERALDQARADGLSAQIRELHGQLRDREEELGKEQELLAHDRDIRELMGARDLYIAEVYDVAGDGQTQKPYGRVFYTRGKSLVFYAYDLDKQAEYRNVSTFQAWGSRGLDKQQATSLGIFYQDNAAKKRWVVKFDDPKKLEQINAVFVTVEPNGGSQKPSGKPLLFAYLKVDPNHP
jgi:hypothetical protein